VAALRKQVRGMRLARARIACAAAGPLLVALVGCSGGADGGGATPESPTVATSPSPGDAEPSSGEPSLPAALDVGDPEGVSLAQRRPLIHRGMANEPDWLAVGFGSVWALQGNGSVLRFAPGGRLLATIDAGIYEPPPCQGLGVSDDAVWACATNGKIIRIDPGTNRVVETVSVPKLGDQGRLVAAAGRLWLLTADGAQLTGVDLTDSSLGKPLQLDSFCTDLAVGSSEALWVVCASDGLLLRVDPVAGEVTGRVALPLPRNAAVADHVWVTFDGGLAKVDPNTLEVVAVYDVQPGLAGGVRAASDAVWIRSTGAPFLTRLDAETGQAVEVITAPAWRSGGDVVTLGDHLWATAYDDKVVVRLTR
jgi:virginiamycin B lyase